MKRCPTCNQTYADDTMSFCLTDGAPLVGDTGGQYSSQATLVSSSDTAPQASSATNPLYPGQSAQNWTQPTMQQFGAQPQRSLLPWIVGGALLLLLLGLIGLGAVGALVYISSGNNRNKSTAPRTSNRSNRNGYSSSNNSNNTSYSDRKGRYTGTASTTSGETGSGDLELEITEINDTTGAMKMNMKFSNGLCGEGNSFGVIDKATGDTTLFGSLTSSGGGCSEATWVITTKCKFSGSDTLKCTYRLTGVGATPQDGSFEVTKE